MTTATADKAPPAKSGALVAVPLAGAMEIPLAHIVPSKTNRRTVENADADKELMESIAMRGVQQPIIVRVRDNPDAGDLVMFKSVLPGADPLDAMYELVAGHRRWKLSHKAGKTTIPAVIRKLSNAEALEIQNIENLQRQDLDPVDRAEAIHDLYQQYLKGMTPRDAIEKIAGRLNCKERALQYMMSLRNALPAVQKAIREGQITMSHGYELAALSSAPQKEVWEWIHEQLEYGDPVSVRDLREHIRNTVFRRLAGAQWNLEDANLVPKAGACTKCPKNTAVNPHLAPEEKKATCTDPPCFAEKQKAHLVQIEQQIKKDTGAGKVVQIAGAHLEYSDTLPKGVIARDDWRESKPESCEFTVAAVVATTNAAGQKKYVCINKSCKKHFGNKQTSFNPGDFGGLTNKVLTPAEKKARLQKVRTKKMDEAFRSAATSAIRKSVTELKIDDLRDLAFELAHRTDRRLRVPICAAMGWPVSERAYYGPEITRKQIDELKPADLASFIALMVIADKVLPGLDYFSDHSKADFKAFAKRHKIDLEKIQAEAEAPLRAKFKGIDARKKAAKPKAKAKTAAKPKAKAKVKK